MRRHTSAAADALIAVMICIGFTGTARAADRDCKDFSSQAEAQAALLPGDPERLDADHDGLACETYGYAARASTSSTSASQVPSRPTGAVAAGDGSTADEGSAPSYVLGGVALIAAAGAA